MSMLGASSFAKLLQSARSCGVRLVRRRAALVHEKKARAPRDILSGLILNIYICIYRLVLGPSRPVGSDET